MNTTADIRFALHATVASAGGRWAGRRFGRFDRSVYSRLPGEGSVFLTLDDGPTPGVTDRLIELLAAQRATATFFLQGDRAERAAWLVRALAAAGHGIGGHGYAHVDAWKAGSTAAVNDLARGVETLEQMLGVRIVRVRPPFGHLTPASAAWARDSGRRITLWDVMGADYHPAATPDRVRAFLRRRVRPGSIAVLHDGPGSMAPAVLAGADWCSHPVSALP